MASEPAKRTSWIATVVKLAIAVGLIAFLVWRGAIDPKRVAETATQPAWVAQTLALVFACLAIVTLRWWLLLRLEEIHVSISDAFRLTLVGHFWNAVLPGAVTGDVVKMYYIGRRHPGRWAEAWATVMIDRIIGLAALVYLSFAAACANTDFIFAPGRDQLRWTFYGNAAAAAGFTVAILGLVLGFGRRSFFADRIRSSKWAFVESLRRGYHTLIRLGERPTILLGSFALGVLSHTLLVLIAITAGHALGERSLSLASYAFVAPVGLFVNSIPFGLPGGIGVGEGAFNILFAWAGAAAGIGANVMLLVRLGQLAWAVVGAALYVFDRRALTPPATLPADATPCDSSISATPSS